MFGADFSLGQRERPSVPKWQVTRYPITVTRDDAGCGHVRAAFLTDLHNSYWGPGFSVLTDAIEREDPDIILIGGDIITAVPGAQTDVAEEFIEYLTARYPVYYACGNHEYRLRIYPETYGDLYKKYFAAIKRAGVIFLPGRSAKVRVNGVNVNIYGLYIRRKYYKRFRKEFYPVSEINDVFGRPAPDAVNILLAHTPKYIETYLKWGADITLCGHNHGGIIRLNDELGLIDPDLTFLGKRSRGIFKYRGRTCIVSAGLGEHTIKLRINNPRELVILDIQAGENGRQQ